MEVIEPHFELSTDEFFTISRQLENYHAVFYQLWELGTPRFTKEIPTAAVRFNKEGHCIEFLFNPDFWKTLNDKEKIFIIAHECLHVILKHGLRCKDAENRLACNVALDIVVNHLLLDQFGCKREEIDPEKKYCWIDTVYVDADKKPFPIEAGQSFEYYYNRLEGFDFDGYILVDIHDFLTGDEGDFAAEKLNESLSPLDKVVLEGIIGQHGFEIGDSWQFMSKEYVPPKKKWETVIRKWASPWLSNDFDSVEQWMKINRRLVMLDDDVIIPTEMELQEKEEDGKIDVVFFIDTSGSCKSLAPRFWKAAKSLPKDRFNITLYCFDTSIYEVDEKVGKLYGFGGTSFHILEERIQQDMKKSKSKYPMGVFVITDGFGTSIAPQIPSRWYWFLSDHSSTYCIDKKCNIFRLKDFE